MNTSIILAEGFWKGILVCWFSLGVSPPTLFWSLVVSGELHLWLISFSSARTQVLSLFSVLKISFSTRPNHELVGSWLNWVFHKETIYQQTTRHPSNLPRFWMTSVQADDLMKCDQVSPYSLKVKLGQPGHILHCLQLWSPKASSLSTIVWLQRIWTN